MGTGVLSSRMCEDAAADPFSGFEHDDVDALGVERLGSGEAGRAGADDDHVGFGGGRAH